MLALGQRLGRRFRAARGKRRHPRRQGRCRHGFSDTAAMPRAAHKAAGGAASIGGTDPRRCTDRHAAVAAAATLWRSSAPCSSETPSGTATAAPGPPRFPCTASALRPLCGPCATATSQVCPLRSYLARLSACLLARSLALRRPKGCSLIRPPILLRSRFRGGEN